MATYTGCSLNWEFWVRTLGTATEKSAADAWGLSLSGSSVTVARAIRAAGGKAITFGLCGPTPTLSTSLLELAFDGDRQYVHLLEVLDETSGAFVPIHGSAKQSGVIGKKGDVREEGVEAALMQLRKLLHDCRNDFGAMTGLREVELRFARELYLAVAKGKRVLTPHGGFCQNLRSSGLLSEVDCLVLNESERVATSMSTQELALVGPRVVIVTEGRRGGHCIFDGDRLVQYKSVVLTEQESPGTGDWFLGSLIAFMDHHGLSFHTVNRGEIESACRYAATIAGHKATISGASNGPDTEFISQLLQRG